MSKVRKRCAIVSAAMVPSLVAMHMWATGARGYEAIGGEHVLAVVVWVFAGLVAWADGRWGR